MNWQHVKLTNNYVEVHLFFTAECDGLGWRQHRIGRSFTASWHSSHAVGQKNPDTNDTRGSATVQDGAKDFLQYVSLFTIQEILLRTKLSFFVLQETICNNKKQTDSCDLR